MRLAATRSSMSSGATAPADLGSSCAPALAIGYPLCRSAPRSADYGMQASGATPGGSIDAEAPFAGGMLVLQRDQGRFEHAQEEEGEQRRQEAPQEDVHPHRRSQAELDQERAAQHHEAQDE